MERSACTASSAQAVAVVLIEAVDQESLFIQKDLSSHPISRESRFVKALAATSRAMVDPRKTSRELQPLSEAAKLPTQRAVR